MLCSSLCGCLAMKASVSARQVVFHPTLLDWLSVVRLVGNPGLPSSGSRREECVCVCLMSNGFSRGKSTDWPSESRKE